MSTYSIHHAPAFPELPEAYRLITFTGAGGKTSLTRWLAASAQASHLRVIVTTTTKIFPPRGERIILQDNGPDFLRRVQGAMTDTVPLTVARRYDHLSGKLIGLAPETVTLLNEADIADIILVEADGAAQKPLKAPNTTEPVIPRGTDLCIAVMGLDGAYQPLHETTVHRPEIFSHITGRALDETVMPEDMLQMAYAPNGLLKSSPADADLAVFLNKADLPGCDLLPERFADLLAHEERVPGLRWFAGSAKGKIAREIKPRSFIMQSNADDRLEVSHEF